MKEEKCHENAMLDSILCTFVRVDLEDGMR